MHLHHQSHLPRRTLGGATATPLLALVVMRLSDGVFTTLSLDAANPIPILDETADVSSLLGWDPLGGRILYHQTSASSEFLRRVLVDGTDADNWLGSPLDADIGASLVGHMRYHAKAGRVYYPTGEHIRHIDYPAGTTPTTIHTASDCLDLDLFGDKVFFVRGTSGLFRMGLGGETPTTLLSDGGDYRRLAIDQKTGKLFLLDATGSGQIVRVNPSGTGKTTIYSTGTLLPSVLEIDTKNGRLYAVRSDLSPARIVYMAISGLNPTVTTAFSMDGHQSLVGITSAQQTPPPP